MKASSGVLTGKSASPTTRPSVFLDRNDVPAKADTVWLPPNT